MFQWVTHLFTRQQDSQLPAYCESDFIVTVDEQGVRCVDPVGDTQTILWNALRTVTIETNDRGPWRADFVWVLSDGGDSNGCRIPLGATGEDQLLDRLQALPEFDDNAFIDAIGSTSDGRFVCWQALGPGAG